jgi:hypothetical protein
MRPTWARSTAAVHMGACTEAPMSRNKWGRPVVSSKLGVIPVEPTKIMLLGGKQ